MPACAGLAQAGRLQDARRADAAGCQHDRIGAGGEGLAAQVRRPRRSTWPSSISTRSTRARVRRSAPAATASSTYSAAFHLAPQRQPSMHLAPHSNSAAPRDGHELELRLPVVAKALAAWAMRVDACPRNSAGQRRDLQLLHRFGDLDIDIHAVLGLQPGRRRRGAAAIHAGCAADHQRAHDVQPFLGEQQAHAVGIDERPQVGAVVAGLAVVDAAFQQQHLLASARQFTRPGWRRLGQSPRR